MKIILLILTILLTLAVLALLAFGLWAALDNFRRKKTIKHRHILASLLEQNESAWEQLQALAPEQHSCENDGYKLNGWLFDRHSKKIAVMLHGIRTTAEFRALDAQFYLDRGYSLFFPDFRGCGLSQGRWYGMGEYERRDMLVWLRLLRERFGPDCQIVLDGVSMGAASALLLAGDGKAENIRAVVADCGFSSAREEIFHCLTQHKLGYPLFYWPVRLWTWLLARYDLNHSNAKALMTGTKTPILFIHGEDDDFVPCTMSQEMFALCASEKMLCTVPGAGHAAARVVDRTKCESSMDEFLTRFVG